MTQQITIPLSVLEETVKVLNQVSEALRDNWFTHDGEESYNNDNIIEANAVVDNFVAQLEQILKEKTE